MTVALAMLVPLAALLVAGGGDAATCAGIRSMTWNATCHEACTTPELYNLCKETLQHEAAAAEEEVTVYALAAARRVGRAYDLTVDAAERMIVMSGSLSRDEREACQSCIASYGAAQGEMAGVEADMAGCDFARTRREYGVAEAAVAACGEVLWVGSPLRARNKADRELTQVAAALGAVVLDDSWES
jgi:hypothetical protein